ncbi:MAG: hypothetical protein GX579_02930 [Chloroflexi bacterium]|nr:hypothetical protein [Chloroflexota bacterium]
MLKIPRLIVALILVVLLLGVGALHAAQDGPSLAPIAQEIPAESYELVGENEKFQLYASQETLAFKVVDKRNGYIWHSNLDEVTEEDNLNRTWTAFAQSGISINYLDQSADNERNSITAAEHTLEFEPIEQGFQASVTFTDPSITVGVVVQLEADGVRVEVPFDRLREADPEYKLGMLHLYPFFGATRADTVRGYMFIPDGSGTLINLAATTKARNMFYGRYYGADLGMIGTLPYDPLLKRPYQLSIPVTGMVHGEKEHAFIAVVEKGASYAEVQGHPAGVTTQFNFIYNAFIYNQSYFQATNRAGAGVTVLQPTTNAFDVVVHYRLLTGDESDYVGMARSYQAYLLDKGMLDRRVDESDDIGIRLEFLGAEKERILFWYRSIPMTTLEQMGAILRDLEIANPDVVYYGWQPRGASTSFPRTLKLDRSLGNTAGLRSLIEEIEAAGGRFHLYLDPQAALLDEGGYSARRDLAMAITNVNLMGYNRDKVNYYLNMEALSDYYSGLSEDIFAETEAGLALDGIGSTLYSDFRSGRRLNREGAIAGYQSLMEDAGGHLAFYQPNDYMYGYMDAYYDIPVSNSGYIYTTEVVPFLQIVLAGYVPYYGPAMNFSSSLRADLLRHADFGVYLSYFLTQEPTANILGTRSEWIYTSSYAQWGDEIEQTYEWLNNLLAPVKGEPIVARERVARGVFATTYANGRQIVVNYNSSPYYSGDLAVEAQDAIIREVVP